MRHDTSASLDLHRSRFASPLWLCDVQRENTKERIWNTL